MSVLLRFLYLVPVFVVSFFIISKKLQHSKWKLPPSPSSLPIIGNLHHLSGLSHRCIHKLCIKYGPVMLLRLGSRPMVVISSSEAAEEVLKTHDMECSSRLKMVGTEKLTYGFKDIGFGPSGEYWREMKKFMVVELFSLKKVQSFRYIREEEIELMVKKVSESALTQTPIDLTKIFFSVIASIICRVAMGKKFNESEFIDQERIGELLTKAAEALGDITFYDLFPGGFGRFLDWLLAKHKKLNKVFEELDAFYQHVIDDHLKESLGCKTSDSPTIVAAMLDMIGKQGKEDNFKLEMDNIKAILMNIFLAGIDTSTITMIWTMTELVRNPRVMKKVQDEIRTTLGIGRNIITEEELNKVDYLQLIIKETFRLHPPVPLVTRQTMSHVKIQGYDIPPETPVQINVWTIGRDPKQWTNPEDFIPERFINSSVDFRGQNFNLLPFGSGRRMCPAIPIAIVAIELTLMNLLYFFDWRLPDGMISGEIDMEEAGTLSIIKKLPLVLVPVHGI